MQKILPGKKYRVRVIGATVLSYLGLALEGHNMTLIEVDVSINHIIAVKKRPELTGRKGTYIDPLPIDDLELGAGQRYSVIIETLPDPPKTE